MPTCYFLASYFILFLHRFRRVHHWCFLTCRGVLALDRVTLLIYLPSFYSLLHRASVLPDRWAWRRCWDLLVWPSLSRICCTQRAWALLCPGPRSRLHGKGSAPWRKACDWPSLPGTGLPVSLIPGSAPWRQPIATAFQRLVLQPSFDEP